MVRAGGRAGRGGPAAVLACCRVGLLSYWPAVGPFCRRNGLLSGRPAVVLVCCRACRTGRPACRRAGRAVALGRAGRAGRAGCAGRAVCAVCAVCADRAGCAVCAGRAGRKGPCRSRGTVLSARDRPVRAGPSCRRGAVLFARGRSAREGPSCSRGAVLFTRDRPRRWSLPRPLPGRRRLGPPVFPPPSPTTISIRARKGTDRCRRAPVTSPPGKPPLAWATSSLTRNGRGRAASPALVGTDLPSLGTSSGHKSVHRSVRA